jgi:hypothetical protein
VGITNGYGLDDGGIGVRVPVRSRIFSSLRRPEGTLGSIQPHMQWVPGTLSAEVKRPKLVSNHSLPANT